MADHYEIHYAEEAAIDVRSVRAFDRRRILDTIERHLADQPRQVSRSRIKAMV